MAKRVSARRVKIHRQYTYEAAAEALGVTAHTVRAWRAVGLAVMVSPNPYLILGSELRRFIENRAPKLAQNQFYCMSCRAPRVPYGGMADYLPINPVRGRLIVLCGPAKRCATSLCRSRWRIQQSMRHCGCADVNCGDHSVTLP